MLRGCATAMTATLLVAVIAVPAVAQQDPEVVGIELVSHPDQQAMGRRGLVSVVAEVQPGAVVHREVVVRNDTRERVPLEVYVEDATIDENGFSPADGQGDLSGWSSVTPSTVELDPGRQHRAVVRIAVPDDVASGERYGVVWVQPPAGGGEVRRVNRVGVRIYLTVTGGSEPQAEGMTDFVITSLTADLLPDGRRQVRAAVTNTGERAVDLVGQLELLEGPGSTRAGPFPTDGVTTLAIGGSGIVTVTMASDVPLGPWVGRLELSSGSVERAAEAPITFPATVVAEPEEVPAKMTPVERQRRILIPIASTFIITLLVILLVILLGRRRDDDDEQSEPVTAAAGPDAEARQDASVGV